jgi:signal transduction histidine kinase
MSTAAKFAYPPHHSKTELSPVFDCAPVGLAQCQPQGNITAFNPAMEQMLGRELGIASSLCFADLLQPSDRAEGERLFRELFERRRDSFHMNSQLTAANTAVRWTGWRVSGSDSNADYALLLVENAFQNQAGTQRDRQAEKLEAVGRLAGGVAHDFNNLLTGILLYCDLLMAHLEPCHRVRTYVDEIRNAGMQAAGLVRQLLSVVRPASSDQRPLSLNQIAEGMRNLLLRLIGENIDLQFRLDGNLGLVRMDPTQMQQILLNLVLNARDAMPQGGQIIVETSNCKVQVLDEASFAASSREQTSPGEAGISSNRATTLPCALFVVSDNGRGMDERTRAHLFDAFFTTKAEKGTGLGLATVYEIVTSHGGLLHVDSALNGGARVSVLLPLVPPEILKFQPNETPDFQVATIPISNRQE